MTASPRPEHRPPAPAGTARTLTRTAPTGTARAAAVGALTALLALGGAPAAVAAPGDNGDIKVHESTTAATDRRDEPQVCRFYLDAFDFDDLQRVSWTIDQQPPTGTQQVTSGTLTLLNGTGQTQILSLPDGHYRVNWTFTGQQGSAKHKVFTVSCPPDGAPGGSPGASVSPQAGGSPGVPGGSAAPSAQSGSGRPTTVAAPSTSPRPSASASPAVGGIGGPPPGGGPHGGLDAGGGGTSHGPNAVEVGAGSALLALAGVIGIRAARRRTARNAAS